MESDDSKNWLLFLMVVVETSKAGSGPQEDV